MDDLLVWFFILTILFMVMARRRQQRRGDDSPVIGYRKLDGEQLAINPLTAALAGEPWTLLALEDMPFDQRRRVVLSLALDDPERDDLEALLWRTAAHIQRRAQAHVVVVEAFDDPSDLRSGQGRRRLLFAPDGRGWTGEEALLASIDGKDHPPTAFDLAHVHQHLIAAERS